MAPARLVSAALLVAYAVFLAIVLTEYNPLIASDVVARFGAWLGVHGVPTTLTQPARVEFFLNAAMFAPVVFLAALALPRHPWANWVVYGFALSVGVEMLQGLFLPPRSAQFEDVVANTLGALIGALAALPLTKLGTTGRYRSSPLSTGAVYDGDA